VSELTADLGRAKTAGKLKAEPALSHRAMAYFWIVVAAALAATIPFLARLGPSTHRWWTFLILGVAVAVAQVFVAIAPVGQGYHPTIVFLIAAALLLPPQLVALVPLIQHAPDLLRRRRALRLQAFTIAGHTLAAMGAWAVAAGVRDSAVFGTRGATVACAGLAACVAFVGISYVLFAPRLPRTRSRTPRAFRPPGYETITTDLVLAMLGVGLATLWQYDAWLMPVAIAPLVLVHRSLSAHALQAEARIDPKTGLFNARHFTQALREELGRAARFDRPMAVIMADLDLLRDINNTHGHLAGDAVLAGVGKVFRQQLREFDIPARFGGDEFSIVLPETRVKEAKEIAERIRRAVAESEFEVSTSNTPIRATLSVGVAGYPRDGSDANELVHKADLAVYRAKDQA
jgi:diguanylate cyclase (GGDEF)-like protein